MEKKLIKCHEQELIIYLRDDADQSVANEVFKFHEYRAAEEAIARATQPIVDVGAHSGLFTLYSRCLNPTIPIYAIEPEPRNVALFKRHMQANRAADVTLVEGALAGASGKRELALAEDNHNHYLLPEKKRAEAGDAISVQAYSLADFLEKYHINQVGLLKMDIEGGEYEAWSSASGDTLRKIHVIIIEYHQYQGREPQEIEKLFRESGFSVQIFPSQFDKRMGFLLARNKRIV